MFDVSGGDIFFFKQKKTECEYIPPPKRLKKTPPPLVVEILADDLFDQADPLSPESEFLLMHKLLLSSSGLLLEMRNIFDDRETLNMCQKLKVGCCIFPPMSPLDLC
jgi:hypothetical protein